MKKASEVFLLSYDDSILAIRIKVSVPDLSRLDFQPFEGVQFHPPPNNGWITGS